MVFEKDGVSWEIEDGLEESQPFFYIFEISEKEWNFDMKGAIEHFEYLIEQFISIIIEIFEYSFDNISNSGKVEANKILEYFSFFSK